MGVHIAVGVDAGKDVIVEGSRQVLNHWILTGQQLVQNVRHSGGADPLSGVDACTENTELLVLTCTAT
jgi:hypothetical protein